MNYSLKALLLSLAVTTASAALAMPAAHAQDSSSSSNFETFEATPKAPRKEPGGNRQIVVEPKVPTQATPKAPPVASFSSART